MATMARHISKCLLLAALTAILNVDASNFNKPHTHTGKVEPFQPGDPKVKLDGKALGILKAGKPYQVCVLELNQC
jgi:hypothetical protein